METVRELTNLGDRVSAGGGFEVDVTVRIRYASVKFREFGNLQCGRRCPLRLKWLFTWAA